MKYYYDWLSMLILSTTGIPLLLLQSKYCSIHWHQVPGISPLSYLWAAVSHFNYFLLDGSISSILFPLLYPWWQYQQYPCLFTISWMALSVVSYSIIIHLYLSFSNLPQQPVNRYILYKFLFHTFQIRTLDQEDKQSLHEFSFTLFIF